MGRPVCIVTRTEPGATATAERVARLGWQPEKIPVSFIEPVDHGADVVSEPVQALAITSVQDARHGADLLLRYDVPVFAVGPASAQAASDLIGAERETITGDSTAERLAGYVQKYCSPEAGPILFLRAERVAGGFAEPLKDAGFTVIEQVVYRARPNHQFTAQLKHHISHSIGSILLHAPSAARAVAEALSGLDLGAWRCLAMSSAIAEPVASLAWGHGLMISKTVSEDSLLAALGQPIDQH